jgi:hypothetical protein
MYIEVWIVFWATMCIRMYKKSVLPGGQPRDRNLSPGAPPHVVQTGSGAHPASYPMGIVGHFHGIKAAVARG